MSRRYVVVCCVRETPWHLDRCLTSLAAQDYDNFTVVVVDDASADETPHVVSDWCGRMGWSSILRTERVGALRNQVDAIRLGCDDPEDVIVFVDGDDRLARTDTFQILNRYYDQGVLLTYGSYEPDPPDAGCSPARPFPKSVIRKNAYRHAILPRKHGGLGAGHAMNHLRTFTFGLFCELDEADFRDRRGDWFFNTPDIVLMVPCIELAGRRHAFVPEVLLYYTSDLASAEWRTIPRDVDRVNLDVLRRPPKKPAVLT